MKNNMVIETIKELKEELKLGLTSLEYHHTGNGVKDIEIKWDNELKWYVIYQNNEKYDIKTFPFIWDYKERLVKLRDKKILLESLLNYDEYWKDAMKNRMNFRDEATRMITVLKGMYLDHCLYNKEEECSYYSLLSFWDSKKPYGSKCIEQSIAFNLGWDRDRLLCHVDLPKYVEKEAMKIHSAVYEKLKKLEMFYKEEL